MRIAKRVRQPQGRGAKNDRTSPSGIRRVPRGWDRFSSAEVLRELETLCLVVRADPVAVELHRTAEHLLVEEATDGLAVLKDERYLARTYLKDGARAAPAGAGVTEARVEEARVVDAEFADERIER